MRLRLRYPQILIVPLMYRIEDSLLYHVREDASVNINSGAYRNDFSHRTPDQSGVRSQGQNGHRVRHSLIVGHEKKLP